MKEFKNFGSVLMKQRISLGKTQADVAVRLGYTGPQIVSNWERGLQLPPPNVLRKLSEIYELAFLELAARYVEIITRRTLSRMSETKPRYSDIIQMQFQSLQTDSLSSPKRGQNDTQNTTLKYSSGRR